MTGYTRNDIANNIADANVINAADLDGEFDAIQAAFDATTGHNHDGTTGGGSPITVVGPAQDIVVSSSVIRPKTDNVMDLGTASIEYKDLFIDGTANIDTLVVDESATIAQNLTVNGNTTLGNAATDTVTVTAEVASALVPSTDNASDLGSAAKEWRDLYLDGTANIDTLVVDESATITANLTVNGNTTLGNATTDTVTVTAQVASALVPATDNVSDLGSATNEWKDLYIDGIANIDSLVADTADINGGTVDGAVIGGTVAAAATFTTANATTVDTANLEVTNLRARDGTAAGSIADTTGIVTLASSVLTTTDINGGTVDGAVIGGAVPAAATFTTANATTVDTSILEVTTLRARDGTAAGSIANATGVVTLASSVLTTADINGGTVDGTVIGASSPAAATFTTGTVTGDFTVDSGTLFVDATGNVVGVGTPIPDVFGGKLNVVGASLGGETTLVLSNNNTSQFVRIGINGDVAQIAYDNADALAFGIANDSTVAGLTTEYMRIDSAGRVGIGTNAPGVNLHVRGDAGAGVDAIVRCQTGNADGDAYFALGDSTDSYRAGMRFANSTDILYIHANNADRITIDAAGDVVVAQGISAANLLSGTYTPTLTAVANVASSTSYVTQYMRVGDVVTVSGHIQITPTAANTDTRIRMALPIASNLGSQGVGGAGACLSTGLFGEPIGVTSDITNDEADFRCRPTTTGARTYGFSFTYRIA